MKFNCQTKAIFLLVLSTFLTASAYAMPDGLVLWMSMDANQTAPGALVYDSSGYGNNGIALGDASQTSLGYYGKGFSLDGDEDYINLGNPSSFPDGYSPRTLCGWGKTNDVAGSYKWIASYGTPDIGQAMFIGQMDTTLVAGGFGDDVEVADFWNIGVWNQICLTYDGANASLYSNGILLASDIKDWNLVRNYAFIGVQVGEFGDYPEYWNGIVDEVMIFNRSLSADEIKSLYTPPTVNLDLPQNNYVDNISQYVDITFNASVSDGIGLQNCALWTDYEGAWQANQTADVAGASNTTSFILYGLTNKTFIWNIQCYNLIGSSAFSSVNRTITLNWTPFCGDNVCNNDETCSSCSSDCGQCAQTGGGRHGGSSGSSTGITYIRRANTSSEIISTPAETTVTEPVAVEKTSLMTTATVAQPTLMRNVMGSSILQIESVKGAGLLLAGLLSSFFIIILAGALLKNRELFYVPTMIIEMLKMPKIKWPKLKFRFLRI